MHQPTQEDLKLFQMLLNENRYDFCKLAYLIWPFGEKGHELEFMAPYDWQMEEWARLSKHLSNPATRYDLFRLAISSGNGAAKTAFGAMTILMLMYTQQLKARYTANTDPQMKSVIWPEIDRWFQTARFHECFFEKFGTSIKARDPKLAETWRVDTVTWNETSPSGISGLHNKGRAVAYVFEEAPGIPAVVFKYASGAFTETETIKIFLAFGNSDDPESYFEQCMQSSMWNTRRIDTRTLKHIDPKQIADWLMECNGNEDADEFRVRVRGLPRKTAKDSIINVENVRAAIARGKDFDKSQVEMLPAVLTCDPAWQGGDETCIWYSQGNYREMLEKFKLDRAAGDTHQVTYNKMVYWEAKLRIDCVFIDQGEGTALYTLAVNAGKTNWFLISFASTPNDTFEQKDSQYHNIRAQMYYEGNTWCQQGGAIGARDPEWLDVIEKQLCWTKGGRHKVTQKKIAEPKLDIKTRVGQSPDVADGFVLCGARPVMERLPEHEVGGMDEDRLLLGQGAYTMPAHEDPYGDAMEVQYQTLYD